MMWRVVKYPLLSLLVLLVPALVAVTFVTATDSGSRWLLREALAYVPGLQVKTIQGRLITGLRLDGVDYRHNGTEVGIGTLTLRWRAVDLLHGTVRISRLTARDVRVHLPPPAAEAAPFSLPARIPLPLSLRLERARIIALQIDNNSRQTAIDELSLSAHAGPLQGLRIRQFTLLMPGVEARLSGNVVLQQPYAFRGTLRWLAQLPDAVPLQGEARFDGDIHRVNLQQVLSGPFSANAQGTLQLDTTPPAVQLSGDWQALRWPLTGAADYASPQGTFRVEGNLDAYHVTLDAPLEINGVPALHVRFDGRGDLTRLAVESLQLAGLDGTLKARGSLAWAPDFALALDIDAKQLNPGVAWSDWPGRLDLDTRLAVTRAAGNTRVAFGKLDLRGMLRGYPVAARGGLAFDAGVPAADRLRLRSGENQLTLSGALNRATGLQYRLDAPQLSAVLPGLSGRAQAHGALKGVLPAVEGDATLSADGLRYRGNFVRSLTIQAHLNAADNAVSSVKLNAEAARFGSIPVDTLALSANGSLASHALQLDLSSATWQVTVRAQGGYQQANWAGQLQVARLALGELGDWRLREPAALNISAQGVEPFRACWQTPQQNLCVRGGVNQERLHLALVGEAAQGHLQGEITLGLGATRQPLSGTLDIAVPDLAFLGPLLPDAALTGGAVNARIKLGGVLQAPQITGSAELTGAKVTVPALGIEINPIGLQVQGKGTDLHVSGSAESGGGTIHLAGDLTLAPARGWPFDLTLQGERFVVAGLPDTRILANPDLRVAGSLQRINVSGAVLVPQARIVLKKLPPDVVKVSADQVIVGPAAASQTTAERVPVSVKVVTRLGDAVHFEGFGLSTNLTGAVEIRSLPAGTLIGNGILELRDGRYEGYGQKLAIQRGRLLFAGPLDNPALDIRATRDVGEVTAGLALTGNADAPQSRLFSDPPLSDGEILSYLVTGKPLSSATTGGDSQALAAAAASFGANNPVTQELSQQLGIDLGVQAGATSAETAFTVGKQLSPRLYVDYIYGMFTQTAAFQVVYKLTDHLSLSGLSGAESAIDLKFSIDKK